MKNLFIYLILALSVSCQKETITKNPTEANPCQIETCHYYEVTLSIDNPDHSITVYKNNVLVTGSFQACTGDTISLALSQNCQGLQSCSQWSINIYRNSVYLFGTAGSSQTASQLYIIP